MKTLKPQHCINGGLRKDYFNSSILSMIGIFNTITLTMNKDNFLEKWYLTIPFFMLSILIFNKITSLTTKSIIFFIMGVVYHVNIIDSSDLGSSVFFILSYIQCNNKKYGLLILLTTLILVVVKSTNTQQTPAQLIAIVSAFVLIYGNVYQVIRRYKLKIKELEQKIKEAKEEKSKPPIRNIDVINISEEEKAIVKLYCNGMTYENISKFLGINNAHDTIRRKITKVKKDNNLESDAKLGKWMFDSV